MSKQPSSPRFPNEERLRLLRSHTAKVGLGWMTRAQHRQPSDAATLMDMCQLLLRGPRSFDASPQNESGTSSPQRRRPYPVLSSSRIGGFLLRSAAYCQYKRCSSSSWDEHQTPTHSYIKASQTNSSPKTLSSHILHQPCSSRRQLFLRSLALLPLCRYVFTSSFNIGLRLICFYRSET